MTSTHIKLVIVLVLAPAITMERLKLPFQKGINCNMESFQSLTHRVVDRYFCLPKSGCRVSPHHIRVMPYDLCNHYYNGENNEDLVCCHESDFLEPPDKSWMDSFLFVPSFKSYIMCRHYSHLLCADDGSSYCDKKRLELTATVNTQGIPQLGEKFPHTALIGYPKDERNKTFKWICMGSIVSERVVMTSGKCQSEKDTDDPVFSTHVKVGESIICDHCTDRAEEQIIPIKRWDFKENKDIYFIFLSKEIQFSQKVRPACLLRQPYSPTTGWYVHYGKPETEFTTFKTIWPVFHYPDNNTFIAFKVKTSQNAVIHLSATGLPNQREKYWEVHIGYIDEDGQTRSSIKQGPNIIHSGDTPNILHKDEFRGFWIKVLEDGDLAFGEEDKETATLIQEDSFCCFNFSVVGLSTPNSTGEWVFGDQAALFSLNGQELDIMWGKKCSDFHRSFETVEKYLNRTNDKHYIGEAEFCAGDISKGVTPCDQDWGSTIQVMDRYDMPCMWQMFGMYSQSDKRNCSQLNSPGVFINFANHLSYIEENAYPWFSWDWLTLKVDRPVCLLATHNNSDPGRCPAYIVPK